MSIGVSKPSFGAVYVSPQGLEIIKNEGNPGREKLEMIKEVAQNQDEAENDFIVDEYGDFKIRNKEYGTFTTANPPNPQVLGSTFSCNIKIHKKGDPHYSKIKLHMKDKAAAQELQDKFSCGTSVPGGVVALYNAMNATAAYEKALSAKTQALVQDILSMTKPYTEE